MSDISENVTIPASEYAGLLKERDELKFQLEQSISGLNNLNAVFRELLLSMGRFHAIIAPLFPAQVKIRPGSPTIKKPPGPAAILKMVNKVMPKADQIGHELEHHINPILDRYLPLYQQAEAQELTKPETTEPDGD